MSYRTYSDSNGFLVALDNTGDFTTIGAALTAATSGRTIFVKDGSYTENLTLKAGVNIVAFSGDNLTPNVTITGFHSFSGAGTVTISNIKFISVGISTITNSGASSILNLQNCSFSMITAVTAISNTNSGSISIMNCNSDLLFAGASFYVNSGSGSITLFYTNSYNTIGTTQASRATLGIVNASYCQFTHPISFSVTSQGTFEYCLIDTSAINTTSLTSTTSGIQSFKWCRFTSGTASGISISGAMQLEFCQFFNSNANAITGAGTIQYNPMTFDSSKIVNPTLTQNPLPTGPIYNLAPSSGTLPVQILCGNGSPNTVFTAPIGSFYSRTDGSTSITRLYVNTDGGTTWTSVVCSA